jgi:hypothetical protein
MSFSSLEKAILQEIKDITSRKNLRLKDLLEWSSSEEIVRGGLQLEEMIVFCPKHKVWAAIPKG